MKTLVNQAESLLTMCPRNITNPLTGENILYFEVDIKPFEQQIFPDLPQPAALVGYDGIAPGPTFIIPQGTETIVRFINHAELANSVHLHGSFSRAPFDGWAEDVTEPGQFKDYYVNETCLSTLCILLLADLVHSIPTGRTLVPSGTTTTPSITYV